MRRQASHGLGPNPRAPNGLATNSSGKDRLPAVGLNNVNKNTIPIATPVTTPPASGGSTGTSCCCNCPGGHNGDSGVKPSPPSDAGESLVQDSPPLQLHGARSEPSALLKVQGSVFGATGASVPVQPMIDSGASGLGFVDPAFVQQCGVQLRPLSQRITLADGSEVRAAGEATLTYTLAARTCRSKESTPPVRFTSTFVVTPLAPYQLILGVGWLEQHRVVVGFGERNIQLRVNGVGNTHCIRTLDRYNGDGSPAAQAAPLQLKAIQQKKVCKLMRRGQVEQLYGVLIRDTESPDAVESSAPEAPPLGSDHPKVKALLAEFSSSVLSEPKAGVPRKRGVEHAIQLLPGAVPPQARPLRHQSEKDAAVMKEYVGAGIKAGILRPSVSPYGSMALIVKKKDGSPRVVIDYRALNEVTIKNKYPLPLMDELFDRTQGARYFTSIDLRNGFHQIAIRPEDREKTAFRTRVGHFEYTVLPMGLCNAPGTFMQLMNQTFADMLDKSVLCFLDDILIFSRTEEEHMQHLRTVLTRLRDQELYVKPSKCAFLQREVSFLGHRIGADGLRVAPDKIGAVQQWPQPRSVTDVRSFLGLANFYRRFVRDYSRVALPLTELTKDTVPWQWGLEQQKAFEALKAALCAPPVLLVPDQSKPFVLNCDACKYAIGATLQQDHGNGLQPVAYFSAKMSDAERNYDVREQEFMALMKACLHWRHYLHGTQPFTLLTDHDSLKYHKSMPNLSGRLARWVEKMAEFDYKLSHIPGKDNVVADALSRRVDLAAVQLGAVAPRSREPETQEQRQRNIDAATKVQPRDPNLPPPDRTGTIRTPTQRCAANTARGVQCGQRTAIAHLCWNHLARDMGVRVRQSKVPQAGRGLFAHRDLPKHHRIPYTGDEVALREDRNGGPYVLELRQGAGVDAARRNAGLGRWVNDPKGAKDEHGRPRQTNCEFTMHTPPGGGIRSAAVRTLRPIVRGEELLVRYGNEYWRYSVAAAKSKAKKKQQRRAGQAKSRRSPHNQRDADPDPTDPEPAAVHQLMAAVVQSVMLGEPLAESAIKRSLHRTASRQAAAAARTQTGQVSARAGRDRDPTATPAVVAASQQSLPPSNSVPVGGTSEALRSALQRAALADSEYQQAVSAPPVGWRASGGLLFAENGQLLRVPADDSLRTRILAELHDSTTGAHCGRDRMLAAAQQRFEWRGMASDVERYATTCDACQRNKYSKQLRPGLLMPLPLPEEPCLHWTTDAVTGLPRSKRGYDAIQVYVDRLTKLKHFAVARTSDTAVHLAGTTLRTIIGPHGMPKSMVSDRDPRITSVFWRELSRVLGSEVNLSTAYHPQSDGQSEREIQTLTTSLRSYVNAQGDDWDEYLPALELALNSKQQASTGAAPFTLVYGTDARLPIDCALDDARPSAISLPAVGHRAERMKSALEHARSQAERAQAKQKRLADRHRRLMLLKDGDMVLLSTDNLQLRSGTHKLTGRYIGPFRVIGAVNANAAKLELPPLLGALHSTFNISRLKLYRDGRAAFPSRPERLTEPPAVDRDTNGVAQYEVECVMAQRGGHGRNRELLIRWKGYGPEHDQWQSRSELVRTAPLKVAEFDALQGTEQFAARAALNQTLSKHIAA